MALTLTEVHRIARLSRIALTDADATATQAKLDSIFGLIAQMQAVDTTGVAPMSHPQDVVQRLREDRVSETDQRAAFQAVAPEADSGLYLVPKVIE